MRADERYLRKNPAAIRILLDDEALLVIDKLAPLPALSSGRFDRNTLLTIRHPLDIALMRFESPSPTWAI